jgi:predicted PurR-regulated permease PerM
MALPMREQAKYWGAAAVALLLALWLLDNVILPFVVGGAIAYFLDPVADRLERLGLSRVAATTIISLGMMLIAVLVVLAVIPTLVAQLTALINAAPDIFNQFQTFLLNRFPELTDRTSTIRQTILQIGEGIRAQGGDVVQSVLGSAIGIINGLVFLVVVPVVSFYLLLDWDRMVARIDGWLPRDHAPVVRALATEIDEVLSAFVRGQLSVCVIMGLFYAIALALTGLQFGMVVGAIAGAITFIPYVGALVGGALAIGLALFQFWGDWVSIGLVAGIFVLGQFLEGNVVTPKMVGNQVGLHPVWLMFALSAFGALFGFLGLLVAVPVAASIGVLIRFGLRQYKDSLLYKGAGASLIHDGSAPAAKPDPLRNPK